MSVIFWWMLLLAILWPIWREKNDRILKGASYSSAELIDNVSLMTRSWTLVREEFFDFNFNDVLLS